MQIEDGDGRCFLLIGAAAVGWACAAKTIADTRAGNAQCDAIGKEGHAKWTASIPLSSLRSLRLRGE
jgi:hypothetical protein